MKIYPLISLILITFLRCNTIETDEVSIPVIECGTIVCIPLPTAKIEKLIIEERQVTALATYITPTSCWKYHYSEIKSNDTVCTIKVFGQYAGEPCIQILSSITHEEKIIFDAPGKKLLRFWNDEKYLDTLIYISFSKKGKTKYANFY